MPSPKRSTAPRQNVMLFPTAAQIPHDEWMDLELGIRYINRLSRLTTTQRTSIINTLRSVQNGGRRSETEKPSTSEMGRTPLRNRSRAGGRLQPAV